MTAGTSLQRVANSLQIC